MPSSGTSAEILRFLDYLIYEPVRTVVLFREGVNVLVPAPERHAIYRQAVGQLSYLSDRLFCVFVAGVE